MIANDRELEVAQDRIRHFQTQMAYMRKVESNPTRFRQSADAFLDEIDRMQLEIRDYLSSHPTELERPDRARLARECAKLDPNAEQALAEEGMR
jgi:hypothetical protein